MSSGQERENSHIRADQSMTPAQSADVTHLKNHV